MASNDADDANGGGDDTSVLMVSHGAQNTVHLSTVPVQNFIRSELGFGSCKKP